MKLYELKVTLQGVSKPPVWRKIVVKSGCNLADLHLIIQSAMGWYNCHLYHFIVGAKRRPIFIGPLEDDFMGFGDSPIDSQSVALEMYLKEEKDSLHYEYDMGDSWMHEIKLEKIITSKTQQHPIVTKAKGACPPENCGGVWGYEEIKEAAANPKKKEHKELLEWVEDTIGHAFDPLEHNMEEANQQLDRFKYSRKKKASTSSQIPNSTGGKDPLEELKKTFMKMLGDNNDWLEEEEEAEYTPKEGGLVNYSFFYLNELKEEDKVVNWKQVIDVKPTAIPYPFKTPHDYADFLGAEVDRILEHRPAFVHINIENNVLAYNIIDICLELDIVCFSSIIEKEISMKHGKKEEFIHVRQFLPIIPL